ncbi:hypothetical protein HPB49_006452 [Dermacentor silvarum]|uniref:Uncharacterized protein n=1 Tax=Dermacentor silvarum TaxID=543639 RepID=A0ACB8DB80_DERSI|nr:hypothetical protein HPB49_006452 [Dermacentor silvarum]
MSFIKVCFLTGVPPCRRIVAVDFSPKMLEFAKKHFPHPRIEYKQLDIGHDVDNFLAEHGTFQRVYSLRTLHWAKDQARAFSNIARLMAPGGECILLFLGRCDTFDFMRRMAQLEPWTKYSHDVPYKKQHGERRTIIVEIDRCRGRACSRGRSGSRPRSSSKPGHETAGRIRSRSRTPTCLRSKNPSLSWADMARGGREAPRGDDLRRDSHHANELEKLRRDNEQLRKENARVKQEMSRLAAEIRKLALSPSLAQPASVPVPVAMDTSEASHGSSAPKRRAVENRQEDETIKLHSELNNAVASMQASLEKVQAAIAHPKMGLDALSERISKLEEVDARPAPSQVAVQRNVLAPPTEGAILRAALSAQPSPQPKHG